MTIKEVLTRAQERWQASERIPLPDVELIGADRLETPLLPGMTCILEPMVPHHFRTEGSHLTVLPVHVFSSAPGNIDQNHPMFNGTKEV